MSVVHSHRQASIDEIAAEMDRRGTVIEKLEAERNLFKGKYRALLKLVSKTRDKLVHVTDHIEDEGDRLYFGSTNDADDLRDLYDEMMRWIWDATDETNRMKSDPYADCRELRSALAEKDARIAELEAALEPFVAMAGMLPLNAGPDNEPIGDDEPVSVNCCGFYLGDLTVADLNRVYALAKEKSE